MISEINIKKYQITPEKEIIVFLLSAKKSWFFERRAGNRLDKGFLLRFGSFQNEIIESRLEKMASSGHAFLAKSEHLKRYD
jgi:hypothetical protein